MQLTLPKSAHASRPWRIHEIAPDFDVEDVWALPTAGGPDDFPKLVELFATYDASKAASPIVRLLFAIRWTIGGLLGWDKPAGGIGSRVPTLRDRLPDDLRDTASGPEFDALPFRPLYLTDDEWAAEIANTTMHGILHVGWVPDDGGDGWHGQMAVLVKRNGLLGTAYMAAIMPFRHVLVYPPMLRELGREWRARAPDPDHGRADVQGAGQKPECERHEDSPAASPRARCSARASVRTSLVRALVRSRKNGRPANSRAWLTDSDTRVIRRSRPDGRPPGPARGWGRCGSGRAWHPGTQRAC